MLKQFSTFFLLGCMSFSVYAGIDSKGFSKLHIASPAIQVSGSAVSIAYYTAGHDFTFGIGGLTYFRREYTYGGGSTRQPRKEEDFESSIFVRKNFSLTENATWGIGASFGKYFPGSGDYRRLIKTYTYGPYISLEYALSNRILIASSIAPIEVEKYKRFYNSSNYWSDSYTTRLLREYSVQLSYLFA